MHAKMTWQRGVLSVSCLLEAKRIIECELFGENQEGY